MADTDTTNFVDRIVNFLVVNEGETETERCQPSSMSAYDNIFGSCCRIY